MGNHKTNLSYHYD